MSKIQEKLDSLQPYVSGIRYVQGVQLVEASFSEGWIIPESTVIRKEKIEQNDYMFFTEVEGISIDDLLDYVKSIIDINIEREKKHELLKEKVKELQVLFKENSLSKLKELKFTFNEPNLVPSLLEMDSDILTEIANEESLPVQSKVEVEAPYAADEYEDEDEEERRIRLIEEENYRMQQLELYSKFNGSKGKNQKTKVLNNVELPPKGQKIEVEIYDLPEELKEGECSCGPEEACPKCLDSK
jgi:hypothetical protein